MGPHRTLAIQAVIVACLALIMLAVLPAAAIAGAPTDPFVGTYRAIDTAFDDSNMLISFGGPDTTRNASPDGPDGIRRVVWLDDNATIACGGGRFFAEGVGFIDGNMILVIVEIYCGSAGNLIGEDVIDFTADPATGTLTDSYGNLWTRH
jgi:hypothetical protein